MDFTGLQMTLTVVVILTAAAVAVFIDHRRQQRELQRQPQKVQAYIRTVARLPRTVRIFDNALEFAPARTMPLRVREIVTVEMASPSPAAPSSSTETLPAFTIDAALWERLISSQPKQNLLSSASGDSQPIQQPIGMIQQPALDELLESKQPFTGLVVSIGIKVSDSGMWHSHGLMPSVGNYIAGLLSEKDFACRTAYDEFVMVCRGQEAAQSQRRLNLVSERLWDYQLRGSGACSILFSCGAVQANNQPLAEALASAAERMRETKRTVNSAQSALTHRQAI
jgi:hypothetical protein